MIIQSMSAITKIKINLKPKQSKYKLVDLFAGTGAFSNAFETTNKIESVFANDLDENSQKIYDLNFQSKFILKDLNDIDVKDIPVHDVLTAGFPCFVADTKVITNNGVKNIQDVEFGDKLLTHTGNYHDIINKQTKVFNGHLYHIRAKYHPYPIKCTEDHPFYVRKQIKQWNNLKRKYEYIFADPEWVTAKNLDKTHFLGMCINNKEIIPEFQINVKKNQHIDIKLDLEEQWYLMGYFFGDGWIEDKDNKIRFSINNNDESEVIEIISKTLPITNEKAPSGKCETFGCANIVWFNILKKFGKYVHGKFIPQWVHDAPKNLLQSFIDGYIKADGHRDNDKVSITTVSYDIAFSIQRILLKLGYIFSLEFQKTPDQCVIQGRIVNQRDTYRIRGTFNNQSAVHSFINNNYVWYKPFEMSTEIVNQVPVYNFEVNEDNSYCVENIIVHNCQPFSIAGLQKGFNDKRSNVFWKILEIIKYHKPRVVLLENVKNLTSHDSGKTFQTIYDKIEEIGYHIQYKVLNTCNVTELPQNRERIYILCFLNKSDCDRFSFDLPIQQNRKIEDFLEKKVDDTYYYGSRYKIWNEIEKSITKDISTGTVYQYRRYYVRENKNGVCPTLTANMGGGGHNVPLIKDSIGIRKLTPKECFNLQGFPSNYRLPSISDNKLYKLAGNAVSVPVIKQLAGKIMQLF